MAAKPMKKSSVKFDFRQSARRHFEDAELLRRDVPPRLPNAEQLDGFSAECALKAILMALGCTRHPDGGPEKPFRVHVNALWDQFLGYPGTARYAACLPAPNPFSDWSVDHRYADAGSIPAYDEARRRDAARAALDALDLAISDGIIA